MQALRPTKKGDLEFGKRSSLHKSFFKSHLLAPLDWPTIYPPATPLPELTVGEVIWRPNDRHAACELRGAAAAAVQLYGLTGRETLPSGGDAADMAAAVARLASGNQAKSTDGTEMLTAPETEQSDAAPAPFESESGAQKKGAAGAAALVERGRRGRVACPGREAASVVGVREGLLHLPLLLAALGAAERHGAQTRFASTLGPARPPLHGAGRRSMRLPGEHDKERPVARPAAPFDSHAPPLPPH